MTKAVFRVAQGINPKDVQKLHKAIKAHSPADVILPGQKDFIWFNPVNGMELPKGVVAFGAIEVNYLQDKFDRLASINSGVEHLLNCMQAADTQTLYVQRQALYADCRALIKLKLAQTKMKLEALNPIDNNKKLKQARELISQFTHFCNVSLHPILATPAMGFLSDTRLSVSNLNKTQELLDRAEECALAVKPREVVYTIAKTENGNFAVDIATPIRSYMTTDDNGRQVNLLSKYKGATKLSTPVILLLENLMVTVGSHPEALYVASSRADNFRGTRNGRGSGNLLLDENGEERFFSESTQIGHISSRAKESEGVDAKQKRANAVVNLEQTIKHEIEAVIAKNPNQKDHKIKIPYLTLVTPIPGLPDYKMNQDKEYAVKVLREKYKTKKVVVNGQTYSVNVDIFSLNNALNPGRHVLPTYAGEVADEYQRLVKEARQANAGKDKILDDLINELESVLNFSLYEIAKSRNHNRELHIASLLVVISARLAQLGFEWRVINGCISNKDRATLCDIYRKSIEEYIDTYKEVPRLLDAFDKKDDQTKLQKRANFIAIYTRRYLSGHGQHLAKQNADGARGTKFPNIYLPKDTQKDIIAKAANPEILHHSELLANDNDIHKMKFPKENALPDYLIAIREEQHYFRSLNSEELRENPRLILGQSLPVTANQLTFSQGTRSRSSSTSTQDSHNSMRMFAGNIQDSYSNLNTIPANNLPANGAIRTALQQMKRKIYEELKSGKYDNLLTGTAIKCDGKKNTQWVPTTIVRLYHLIDAISADIKDNKLVNNKDILELTSLASTLQYKGTSISLFRKPVTEKLYLEMAPQVSALRHLIQVNQQPVTMSVAA
jgi:hypothetical protein